MFFFDFWLCLHVCLSLSHSVFMSVCLCPNVCLSLYHGVYMSVCLCLMVSTCPTVSLPRCLHVCLSLSHDVYMPVYLSPTVSTCLSISVTRCLRVCVSLSHGVYMSVSIPRYLYIFLFLSHFVSILYYPMCLHVSLSRWIFLSVLTCQHNSITVPLCLHYVSSFPTQSTFLWPSVRSCMCSREGTGRHKHVDILWDKEMSTGWERETLISRHGGTGNHRFR